MLGASVAGSGGRLAEGLCVRAAAAAAAAGMAGTGCCRGRRAAPICPPATHPPLAHPPRPATHPGALRSICFCPSRHTRLFKVPDAFIPPAGARVMSLTVSLEQDRPAPCRGLVGAADSCSPGMASYKDRLGQPNPRWLAGAEGARCEEEPQRGGVQARPKLASTPLPRPAPPSPLDPRTLKRDPF